MPGDTIVYATAIAMVAFIPLCFRIAARAEQRAAGSTPSPARTYATLILGTITLTGGLLAALFGGTWWLSPGGSVAATAVVGAMLCALVALTSTQPPAARPTRLAPARPESPLRRAA